MTDTWECLPPVCLATRQQLIDLAVRKFIPYMTQFYWEFEARLWYLEICDEFRRLRQEQSAGGRITR